jgi:putative transposase
MNCSLQEPRRDLGTEDAEGLLKQLTKAILEPALEAEMTNHLGYYKYSTDGKKCCNSCNGKTRKSL